MGTQKLNKIVILSLFFLIISQSGTALAGKTIEERISELEQEIQLLKRQLEVQKEVQIKKDAETSTVSAGKEGFSIQSEDSSFQLKFRGQIQADGRFYAHDDPSASDTFLLRKVRPTLEGVMFKYFNFKFMPDFGGGNAVIQDAWLDFKYWKAVQLRVGKFKSPVGLERLQSDAATQFIEAALSTNLVPGRDVGIDFHGEFFDGALAYDFGVFNGVADGVSSDADIHDDKEFVGRVFALPFKNTTNDYLNGFGIGLGGSAGKAHGSTLPAYRSGGQQTIFGYTPASGSVRASGNRLRLAPQAYYYYGPFGILSEFVFSSQKIQNGTAEEKMDNKGWQIAGSYVLTGENASYNGVIPRHEFDPKTGDWGAFELAGRFSSLSIDDEAFPIFANPLTSVEEAKAWTLGLNWYLNRNLKFMTDFEETFYDGGLVSGGDRKNEHVFLSRLQIYF